MSKTISLDNLGRELAQAARELVDGAVRDFARDIGRTAALAPPMASPRQPWGAVPRSTSRGQLPRWYYEQLERRRITPAHERGPLATLRRTCGSNPLGRGGDNRPYDKVVVRVKWR